MITYSTDIHPGESWPELTAETWPQVLEIKKRVSPHRLFPVDLRVSSPAARHASARDAAGFLETCTRNGCYIPTINGVPYGPCR